MRYCPVIDRTNTAALIPSYFEEKKIRDIARRTRQQLDTVIVVDDGSTDATECEALAAGAEVLRHSKNQGKGAAIKTGLREILSRPGIMYVLILDGDGQHLPEEIPSFLETANRTGEPMLIGNRMSDTRTMPLVRKITNRVMSFAISAVCGQSIPDSQCGFRMIHRDLATALCALPSTRYDFESEMLVIAARRGSRIASVPITTIYGDEKSKIHPFRDTVRFLELMSRLRAQA